MIKIKPDPKRPAVTNKLRRAVTNSVVIKDIVTKKRGRPRSATPSPAAERQRASRERRKAAAS